MSHEMERYLFTKNHYPTSMVNGFLFNYRDHDIVIESSTSGKYFSKELSMLGYKVHLINPAKVPEIANNYRKTDKEDSFQLADVFRKGGIKEIYIPSQEIENIRTLVRYINLNINITRIDISRNDQKL